MVARIAAALRATAPAVAVEATLAVAVGAAPTVAVGAAAAPCCLLVNPRSFAASRGLAARAIAVARRHGAEVIEADHPAAFDAAIDAICARRQGHVIVLAGDGTVQAIVDRLAHRDAGAWRPDVLALPGGRSNLTAAGLGLRGGALDLLERALVRLRDRRWDEAVVEWPLLRVAQAGHTARHGFFFGGALVDGLIREVHRHRASGAGVLRQGAVSTPWGLLGAAASALAGRSPLRCPDLVVAAGAHGVLQGPMRLLLATTLGAAGRLDPYAARGRGDLRVTAVTRRAAGFWRALPRLVTGRYSAPMNPANGYLSGRCDALQASGLATYCLDGEEFDADPSRSLTVAPGPRLRFLRP